MFLFYFKKRYEENLLSSKLNEPTRDRGMGKVRPAYIKRSARILLEKYPNKFTADFEHNKRVLMEMTNISSKKIRNRVAGYITRLVKQRQRLERLAAMRQEITLTEEEEYIERIEGKIRMEEEKASLGEEKKEETT